MRGRKFLRSYPIVFYIHTLKYDCQLKFRSKIRGTLPRVPREQRVANLAEGMDIFSKALYISRMNFSKEPGD